MTGSGIAFAKTRTAHAARLNKNCIEIIIFQSQLSELTVFKIQGKDETQQCAGHTCLLLITASNAAWDIMLFVPRANSVYGVVLLPKEEELKMPTAEG